MADNLLVFDGHGHVTLRRNSSNEADLRLALSTFSSPIELNLEEEDHKQLTAILRSRRIRDSIVAESSRSETSSIGQGRKSLAFVFSYATSLAAIACDLCWNLILGASENFQGTPAALRQYSQIINSDGRILDGSLASTRPRPDSFPSYLYTLDCRRRIFIVHARHVRGCTFDQRC